MAAVACTRRSGSFPRFRNVLCRAQRLAPSARAHRDVAPLVLSMNAELLQGLSASGSPRETDCRTHERLELGVAKLRARRQN